MSGYIAALGLGKESTYGTAVARAIWMRVLSCDLHTDPMFIEKAALGGLGISAPMARTQALDRETSGGSITVEAAYDDGTAFLLSYLLGCTPTEGGGGGPTYTHTYTLQDPASLPVGMTMEQIKGYLSTTAYSDVFEGGVCPGGVFSVPENGPATLQMDIIAETSAARNTAGTPTFHTGEASTILGWHGGNLSWSSLAGKVKSFELTVRLNLERRWVGGSRYTLAPRPVGSLYSVKARVVREWDENTMHTAYKAGTQADGTITFSGPSSQSLAITLQNAICTQYADPSTRPGINDQTFELTCHSDGTDKGLSIVLTNTQSVYTAN